MTVYLIGAGMGGPGTLTEEAREAIASCVVLVGAPRLLEAHGDKHCVPLIVPSEIAAYIKARIDGPVGVLLSGDTGFYSGAKGLWPLLSDCAVKTLPGVGSLSYFCARLQTAWQDAFIVSAHGRAHNAGGEIQCHEKTFALTGGQTRAEDICKDLCVRGLGGVRVWVGERLSYPDERICTGTAEELSRAHFAELAVLLAENHAPIQRAWAAPALSDCAFLRGEVPMTKETVRALAICKLRLARSHTLWDVGAGTGSFSVEGALAVPAGRVYAVEKKEAAFTLLAQNKAHFGVTNLELVAGRAPEALEALPAPDRVFLGGTSGTLEKILKVVFSKNATARVALTAITLETLGEAVRCCGVFDLADVDITQIAVTKTRVAGGYHMLDAQNPVWLVSGEGRV